ncbi:HD family phosphohydrolase [Aneurinibacillus uraniidurans]|uniref:HD family phosphohydrolase n=1 Tax=Aneurinibacillus uraniidurans TaxID=2966586 RepID=UPI00234BAF4D|nr:HDIG domain-containing metalloprotein [Aneurinibacillus sp. B1]WCN38779.1 HDIG domain-containing protein [Aneurinibacillus sp. B1]
MKAKLRQLFRAVPDTWKTSATIRSLLFIVLGLLIYLPIMSDVLPKTFDLNVNTVSGVTLTAPVTVEDTEATEQARAKAVRDMRPVYARNDAVTVHQLKLVNFVFKKVTDLQGQTETTPDAKLKDLKESSPFALPGDTMPALLAMPAASLTAAAQETNKVVTAVMQKGIDQNVAREEIQQQVNQQLVLADLDSRTRKIVREIAIASIVPNVTIDEEATNALKETVRRSVKPTMIYKGEVLVEKGQYISEQVYHRLDAAGLLERNASYLPFFGLAMCAGFFVLFLAFYLSQAHRDVYWDNSKILLLSSIICLTIIVMKITSMGKGINFFLPGYAVPIALGSMLIAILLDTQLAVICSVLFAFISGIVFNYESLLPVDFRYVLYGFVTGVAGAYSLGKATKRTRILQAGFLVAIINVLTIVALYLLLSSSTGWRDVLNQSVFGILSGMLAAILAIGFLPLFEGIFGILSPMRLIELSNPNQPLMRRLLMETPGTYHHSMMVANLSEAACEAVGADGLLARVGAYYHDVGKMKRPHFFVENQINRDNPHDTLAPGLSKRIIIAHVEDGVKMLKEYNIPKQIIDFAQQHHGTTLLKFFYHKASQLSETPVSEEEYRYPGPKAQTRETAIVGICDSAEAAVRSLASPTPERIEQLVRRIIADRLEDGQFNECDLTMQELERVTKSICETLQGFFHNRIEYPDDKQVAVKQA